MQHPFHAEVHTTTRKEYIHALSVAPVDWSFDRELCFTETGEMRKYDQRSFREALRSTVEEIRRAIRAKAEKRPRVSGASDGGVFA